jgi:heterodisulfide reductase subunit B
MLSHEILDSAREARADLIVTACPLCQFNLDYPQRSPDDVGVGTRLPVVYFTQLIAVALGLPAHVCGFEDHYVDPRPLIAQVQKPELAA